MVHPAEHSPVGSELELEVVTEQPRGRPRVRQVRLFRIVPPIFDPARKLQLPAAIAQADSRRFAIGRGAGQRVAQLADLRAAAEIPAFSRHEIDSGGTRKAGLSAVLVTLLEINIGTVGESSLDPRCQVALAELHAVVGPLVFQRIVHVDTGQVGKEVAGAELSAGLELSFGGFAVDTEAFRQPIRTAQADAIVAFTSAAGRNRVLDEARSEER